MNATITEAALALRAAHDTGTPCPPVRARLPKGDVDAAYAVQDENTRHWLAQKRRLVGRKIGLTAKSGAAASSASTSRISACCSPTWR